MARPIFVWRLDELKPKATIREEAHAELKVETPEYRVWLVPARGGATHDGTVQVDEKNEHGRWVLAEEYVAKT